MPAEPNHIDNIEKLQAQGGPTIESTAGGEVTVSQNNLKNEELISRAWQILRSVNDPEVPVLSVIDLGIIRNISIDGGDGNHEEKQVVVTITPTYSGCPAMDVIAMQIRFALIQNGFKNIQVKSVLSPAWTTEWMTDEGKNKLKAYGIAPPNPQQSVCSVQPFQAQEAIQCPRCNSYHTEMISQFGSTACKALYRCLECKEPFDYFKCH